MPINKAEQLAKQFEGRGPQGRRKLLSKLERVGPNKIKTHTEYCYWAIPLHLVWAQNLRKPGGIYLKRGLNFGIRK